MAANHQYSNTVSYVIRRARRDDCDDLYRLMLALADHEGINMTMTKDIILEDAFGERPYLDFFVGECQPLSTDGVNETTEERKVIAFASMSRFNHRICHGRSAYLSGLYIDEAHRGKGLGGAIMKAVSKACQDLGLVQIDFDVLATNTRTRKFYSRLGATNITENNNWEFWKLISADMKKLTSNTEPKCPSGVSITIQ